MGVRDQHRLPRRRQDHMLKVREHIISPGSCDAKIKGVHKGAERSASPLRLIARGVDGGRGAAAARGASPGPPDGSPTPAAPSASREKNRSPPSDTSLDTPTPGGISTPPPRGSRNPRPGGPKRTRKPPPNPTPQKGAPPKTGGHGPPPRDHTAGPAGGRGKPRAPTTRGPHCCKKKRKKKKKKRKKN